MLYYRRYYHLVFQVILDFVFHPGISGANLGAFNPANVKQVNVSSIVVFTMPAKHHPGPLWMRFKSSPRVSKMRRLQNTPNGIQAQLKDTWKDPTGIHDEPRGPK